MTRERRLTQVFIELADTLVAEFDLVDFLGGLAEATVELIEVDAAGLMLADDHGVLHVMASSDDQAELLELFELQQDDGPCPACFRSGQPVVNIDLRSWPDFAAAAAAGGYVSAHALPLRLRGQVIGAMNLFRSDPGAAVGRGRRPGAGTVRHGHDRAAAPARGQAGIRSCPASCSTRWTAGS